MLAEALKMALRSLLHNRLRTALTMLGIIIGVASVVALMAIGNGAKQDFRPAVFPAHYCESDAGSRHECRASRAPYADVEPSWC